MVISEDIIFFFSIIACCATKGSNPYGFMYLANSERVDSKLIVILNRQKISFQNEKNSTDKTVGILLDAKVSLVFSPNYLLVHILTKVQPLMKLKACRKLVDWCFLVLKTCKIHEIYDAAGRNSGSENEFCFYTLMEDLFINVPENIESFQGIWRCNCKSYMR